MTESIAPSSEVATSLGVARVTHFRGEEHSARLVLGHGAGGGIGAPDLQHLARVLPRVGIDVALVEQPWVVAGRRVAPAPTRLDQAWVEICEQLEPVANQFLGGRSAGARVAARTAASLPSTGLVLLAFPLHPPGKPAKSRCEELTAVHVPAIVVQGTSDPFGSPTEVSHCAKNCETIEIVSVPDADHGFRVPARSSSTTELGLTQIGDSVAKFLLAYSQPSPGPE